MQPEPRGDMTEIDRTIHSIRRHLPDELELPNETWLRQSGPFTSTDQFVKSSFKSMRQLLRYGSPTPSSRVLDYGCGLARLAIPLSGYLDPAVGRYVGIDTDNSCIAHNNQIYEGLQHFDFQHVNLFSAMYNRDGRRNYRALKRKQFGPFDLAILFSVFTHILPENADDLLSFLRSQIDVGGEVLSTWFLLNPATEQAIADGLSHRPFPYSHGSVRLDNEDIPEGAVAYQESEVLERFERAGFTRPRIHFGKWRGNLDSWFWQDIVVADVA